MRVAIDEDTARVLDGVSIVNLAGILAGVLPHLASILTIVWVAIRIYETPTVQKWLGKEKKRGRNSLDG